MAGEELTHSQILESLAITEDFFVLRGRTPQELIVDPLLGLSERLRNINGYMGLLGVGYPFYAMHSATGETLPVPAIDEYLDHAKDRVKKSAEVHGEYWPCADCQVTNKLPNLTDQCVPCELVAFKPRDLFRALPDIDAIAVFQETSEYIEEEVQTELSDMGWIRFNTDIDGAFKGTVRALSSDQPAKLPIDFHILTFEQLLGSFKKVVDNPIGDQVGALSRAWRAKWKDQPIDISYSFAFSMTELGYIAPDLRNLLSQTRKEFVTVVEPKKIIEMVDRSKRCGPVIGDMSLRGLLENRLRGWA